VIVRGLVVGAVLMNLILLTTAHADPILPTPAPVTVCGGHAAACPEAGADDTFTPVSNGGTSGQGGSNAPSKSGAAISLPDTYVVYDYAPTCTSNTRTDTSAICVAAATSCKPQGQGLISYWRWEATVSRSTGKVIDPPGWVQSRGSYCLGPAAAGAPPVAAVGGILAAEFKNLLVMKGTVTIEPKGTTLVNYETGFSTEAHSYVLAPVSILGHRVVVTAIPQGYDWFFGDGETLTNAGPGQRGTQDISHTYRRTGAVAPYVVITWRGTFTVDGGPPQDVFGTAQTTSPTTPLRVKQARAELVSH
jgi:hypothetical protein